MKPVTADSIDILRQRSSEKWTAYPADVLPLFVAEMDYPLAPVIAQSLMARIAASDTGYVGSSGALPLAFAGFAKRAWGWTVDPERVRTTTDVSVAIVETLRQAISPGDAVVITPPVYPPFFDLIPEAGGVVAEVPLLDDGAIWSIDLVGLERAFATGATAMLLCNPHNPLGLVHSRESLEAVALLADTYKVTVISDEIHGPLVHPGVHFSPYLSVSDAARKRGVTVTSASKGWNLAGLKCAIMVAGGKRGMSVLEHMPYEVAFRTSLFGLHASIAAFEHGEEWLDGALASITANRELLSSLLTELLPDVRYRMPDASYLAWLDFTAMGLGDDPSIRILDEARVALNAGPTFGTEGRGFARLNLACSPEVLSEAIMRMALAL